MYDINVMISLVSFALFLTSKGGRGRWEPNSAYKSRAYQGESNSEIGRTGRGDTAKTFSRRHLSSFSFALSGTIVKIPTGKKRGGEGGERLP